MCVLFFSFYFCLPECDYHSDLSESFKRGKLICSDQRSVCAKGGLLSDFVSLCISVELVRHARTHARAWPLRVFSCDELCQRVR